MRPEARQSASVWMDGMDVPAFDALQGDERADVCVVGAGIAGLMTALLLVQEGKRVIVLEDGEIGSGETGRTTAHIASALDDRFHRLEQLHGAEGARLAAESHAAAVQRIHDVCRDERIDCDFAWVDGYLFPRADQDPDDVLITERDAAQRAGLDVAAVDDPPYTPFSSPRALRFRGQARVHALKLLSGLARAVAGRQGRIFTATHVDSITAGAPVRVHTSSGHTVLASACVVATNSPISDRMVTHLKQAPYRTYVVGARIPSGSVPDALYWDDDDPYIYIRIQPAGDHDILIVGGEDHKTGQKDDGDERLDRLEAWTREHFPMVESFDYRWSGQVLEPADALGFIGRNPGHQDNVYLVTGDSGNGMTNGTVAGMLLTDLIMGRENPWSTLYDPGRVSLRSAADLARENLNVAVQYAAHVLPGDVAQESEIPAGEGRIVVRGGHKVAVYRDERGAVHERSAICPHLKCVVDWNSLERSWDCPCHGSRFDPMGRVLNGPALSGLEEVGRDR